MVRDDLCWIWRIQGVEIRGKLVNGTFVKSLVAFIAKQASAVLNLRRPWGGGSKERAEIKWTVFKIFLGSPGGLKQEREQFCKDVDEYNKQEANPRDIHFSVFRWEDLPAEYGRPQTIVNRELEESHAYVLVLWDRWGSPPGSVNGIRYSSGSEEEFRLAEKCLKTNRRMKKIAVYFKDIDEGRQKQINEELDRKKQFEKVLAFRQRCEQDHTLLYNPFQDINSFQVRVRSFLGRWVQEETGVRKPIGIQSVMDYEEPDKDPLR